MVPVERMEKKLNNNNNKKFKNVYIESYSNRVDFMYIVHTADDDFIYRETNEQIYIIYILGGAFTRRCEKN